MSPTTGQRSLRDECQYLKGVGPARAAKLRNLGIESVNDLLCHFPRKYYDRRRLQKIAQLPTDSEVAFLGQVLTATQGRYRARRAPVTAAIGDDTGVIQVVWFNQPYLLRHLKPGSEIIASGRVSFYRGQRQLVNPEFERVGEELGGELITAGRIVPVYGLTSGLTQRYLRALVMRTLDAYAGDIPENLPAALVDRGMPSRAEALRAMHFPEDEPAHARACDRIKLEELFYMQLLLSLQRRRRRESPSHIPIDIDYELEKAFLSGLPFELTGAQSRVIEEIHGDLAGERGMNRLLQGDVGSGKTIVAGTALLAAVESGNQAALMVPTEILALQHFRTLQPHFERLGISSTLLIGSLKAAQKREIHTAIASGGVQVVIGTHALIQSEVRFDRLAVLVIDEQHRFGVRQRAALLREDVTPHMLVMTATPIPRTLALTAYADLDLSVLDEMPAIRAAVGTHMVTPDKREAMYGYIADRQAQGDQAFLLYPLIEETEKQDLEAAQSAFDELKAGPLKGVPMALLHGRMGAGEKDEVMRAFAAGHIRVLVTTTVVEVGVDVPAATIMAVHHPERFGLSQLHQLRGRVGRGGREGFCFLVARAHMAPETRERLQVLVDEPDGFRIAEEDLRLRGPGEFLGVRQHGVPGFKVANPIRDGELVERANEAVRMLLETDAGLESGDGRRCRHHVRTIVSDDVALRAVV